MMCKKNLVIVFLFLYVAILSAQNEYNIINYGIEHGLNSTTIYDVFEDNRGYTWIGTNKGVTRFDGRTFKNFTDEIENKPVHSINQDVNGNIVLGMEFNSYCIYNGQNFLKLSANKSMSFEGDYLKKVIICQNKEDFFVFGGTSSKSLYSKSKKLEEIQLDGFEISDVAYHKATNEILTLYRTNEMTKLTKDTNYSYTSSGVRNFGIFNKNATTPFTIFGQYNSTELISLSNGDVLIRTIGRGKRDSLYLYKGHGKLELVADLEKSDGRKNKIKILKPLNSDLYIDGFYIYKNTTKPYKVQEDDKHYDAYHANSGIWLYNENGLKKLIPTKTNFFQVLNFPAEKIVEVEKNKYISFSIGGWSGGTALATDGKKINRNKKPLIDNSQVEEIKSGKSITTKSSISLGFSKEWGEGYYKDKNNNFYFPSYSKDMIYEYSNNVAKPWLKVKDIDFINGSNDTLFIHQKQRENKVDSILLVNLKTKKTIGYIIGGHFRYGFLKDNQGYYWCADEKRISRWNPKNNELKTICQHGANRVFQDNNNSIWFGIGCYLGRYNKLKDTIDYYDIKLTEENMINGITQYDNSRLLLTTRQGLYFLNLDTFYQKNKIDGYCMGKYSGYEYSNFFDDRNQKEVFKDSEGNIFIPTMSNLLKLNKAIIDNEIDRKKVKRLLITKINNIDLPFEHKSDTFEIKLDKNGFRASVEQTYENIMNPMRKYTYALDGHDTTWVKNVQKDIIEYENLKDGTYILKVQSQASEGEEVSTDYVRIVITTPPWTKTYFWIGLVFLFLLGVDWLVDNYKEKKAIHRQTQQMQLQLLSSRMNPHFLNNAISMIENKVRANTDPEEGGNLIVKLGKLIRGWLEIGADESDLGRTKDVRLEKEIKLLRSYLDFYQKTYNNFEYEVEYEEDLLEQDYYIPPFLLQPYVENALKYGVAPSPPNDIGRLRLRFFESANSLICCIEDNGTGIENTKKTMSNLELDRKPLGMETTENMIAIINSVKTYYKIEVVKENVCDDIDFPGTRIVMKFILV